MLFEPKPDTRMMFTYLLEKKNPVEIENEWEKKKKQKKKINLQVHKIYIFHKLYVGMYSGYARIRVHIYRFHGVFTIERLRKSETD